MQADRKLIIRRGHFTDIGPKEENQDFYGMRVPDASVLENKGIAACIADGVSAASAAREAAETSVCGFLNDYFETPETWDVKTAGQRVIASINRWLYAQGQGYSSVEKGCVTTFTTVVFQSDTAHVFHIGDSRLYLLRNGELEQITRDHSAQVSPGISYLTRAMGITLSPRIDYHSVTFCDSDLFALTTDGIHDFLPFAQLKSILNSADDMQVIAGKLGAATAHSDDNRSCLLLGIDMSDGYDDDVRPESEGGLTLPKDMRPRPQVDSFSGFLELGSIDVEGVTANPHEPQLLRQLLFWKLLCLVLLVIVLWMWLTK